MWLFIIGDMTVFAGFFLAYLWSFHRNREQFVTDSAELVLPLGLLNTLILLASSYFVIEAINRQRRGLFKSARSYLAATLACAGAFAVSKALEYGLELHSGHGLTSGEFFMYYFVLTGLHLMHVGIGSLLLIGWRRSIASSRAPRADQQYPQAVAVYWHMVDLLWVIIFALLYLGSSS